MRLQNVVVANESSELAQVLALGRVNPGGSRVSQFPQRVLRSRFQYAIR